jgi:endonuclease/exonuclease/phosphatase family metal-dependent hydrolase
MLQPTIGGQIDGWQDGDPEGMRIDYVLIDQRSPLRPVSAHTVFGPGDYGVVSDHLGVVVDFEVRES